MEDRMKCDVRYLHLTVSKARIELCKDIVHIELMPVGDVAERHVYPFYGRVEEVANEIEKLINDLIVLLKQLRTNTKH
jgi:hypothetical protein